MNIVNANFEVRLPMPWEEMIKHIEWCGRTCYKSEDLITETSAEAFMRKLIDSGHESVIEHIGFTVKFIEDRGITHEHVRHRITSLSQESTRYCNYSKGKFGNSITVVSIKRGIELDAATAKLPLPNKEAIIDVWMKAMIAAEKYYMKMIELGASAQIARSVLPQSTKAELVISANIREWRHILKLRTSRAAHPQMREVMIPLLRMLQKQCPVLFGDIEPDPESVKTLRWIESVGDDALPMWR